VLQSKVQSPGCYKAQQAQNYSFTVAHFLPCRLVTICSKLFIHLQSAKDAYLDDAHFD